MKRRKSRKRKEKCFSYWTPVSGLVVIPADKAEIMKVKGERKIYFLKNIF